MKFLKSIFFRAIFLILILTIPAITIANNNNDEAIVESIRLLLKKEADIPSNEIAISSKNKIVTLSGKIDTTVQANRIIELASGVNGVIDVKTDKLKIKSSKEFLSDAFITAKAKGKIKYLALNKIISSDYKLHIETTNRVVHIFGSVGNKQDIKTIKDSINNIIDVDNVKINITCK